MPAAVCLENQQGLARWFCTAGPLARCAGMSESDAGVDEPDSIKVFKCTAIRAPGLKSTWLPAVQTVAGDEYIKLSKWDRHLTHFVTSKPLNLHAGGGRPLNNINVQWFEDMCLSGCRLATQLSSRGSSRRQTRRECRGPQKSGQPRKKTSFSAVEPWSRRPRLW